ncbi:hypothetical protein [Sinorhizobium mexicanum]|nr:hypothetical protein [Sinorhizobium mexicanum]MBP1887682.1 opacity protein-like surface antigen [Sinorhizobium mexicanum]
MKRFAFLAALAAPAIALALAIAAVDWLEPTAGVSNETTASTNLQVRVP